MKRKICPECSGFMGRMTEADGSPIWGCFNCSNTMRRRTWKTKARKERDARIAQTVEKYGLDGCDNAAITAPTSTSFSES